MPIAHFVHGPSQDAVETLMGPESKEAVQQLMSRMDTDGDGGVQIDEWLAFMQKHELAFRKAVNARWPDAAAAFKALDSDGNGSLEVEELQVHQPDAVPAPSLCTDIRLKGLPHLVF